MKAESPIRISAGVSGTDKIQREGDVYTFTENIVNQSIVVEEGNIVIDGGGYTLEGTGDGNGIYITTYRKNVTVKNLRITKFKIGIYGTHFTGKNTFFGNIIEKTESAIYVSNSPDNHIIENIITDNQYGIRLNSGCNYNKIVGNKITANAYGILIASSINCTLRNNAMNDNKRNLSISSTSSGDASREIRQHTHDVDTSNTVNGKTGYYWVNEQNRIVPAQAGYVVLVNCTNIFVQNLNLTNGQNILLAFTKNSTITRNHITNSSDGIILYGTNNITVTNNYIANSESGIKLSGKNNFIFRNNIVSNTRGISISSEQPNKIVANNIVNNTFGIYFDWCNGQIIYHNNFINNTEQVTGTFWDPSLPVKAGPQEIHVWDNGVEGNYWSDYEEKYPNATELGSSGIWNTPYYCEYRNNDCYPLITPVDIETVPEFPSWIILPLFLITVLFGVTLKKRICYRSAT